jgi:hypothetical protein
LKENSKIVQIFEFERFFQNHSFFRKIAKRTPSMGACDFPAFKSFVFNKKHKDSKNQIVNYMATR